MPSADDGGLPSPAARVDMHYVVEMGGTRRRVELPFVTAVLADLRGQPSEAPEPVAERALVEIDDERFDAVMAALLPRLLLRVPNVLTGEGELSVELRFRRMSDFQPGAWMQQVEALRVLQRACADAEPAVRSGLRASIDQQASAIVHHPAFIQLEASWRALRRLVSESECDDTLQIRVLSLTRTELAKTLRRYKGTGWDQSPVFKRFYDEGLGSPGGAPIGCILMDFAFDHSPQDVEILGELSRIASACHAVVVAAAAPALMQMESWSELTNPRDLARIFMTPEYAAWRSLRDSDDSRYLVLTLPRYLARAPHGWADPSGAAPALLETVASGSDFVWCNAAYLLAEKLHQAFKVHGWCAPVEGLLGGSVEGLPRITLLDDNGLPQPVCVTEVPIADRRAAELIRVGLTPIASVGASGWAVFADTAVLNQPAQYDDPQANANSRLAARLPVVLTTSRLAHYLRGIMRDVLTANGDIEAVRAWLRDWIADYIDDPAQAVGGLGHGARPFAAAEIELVESPDAPGTWTSSFFVRPASWVMGRDRDR